MKIRPERLGDEAAIDAVVDAAFASAERSGGNEGEIVRRLRTADALTISLVAEDAGMLVGHLAVSPVTIDGRLEGWFGLGPVAVLPARHRSGIGSALIQEALEQLRGDGAKGCVVLGEPDYYRRFGFVADPGLTLPGSPARYFQLISFAQVPAQGHVTYHPAFG